MLNIILFCSASLVCGLLIGAGITAKLMNKKVKDVADQVAQLAINTLVDEAKLVKENGEKLFNEKILSKVDKIADAMKERGKEIKSEAQDAIKDFIIDTNENIKSMQSKIKKEIKNSKSDVKNFIVDRIDNNPLFIRIKKLFK